MKKTIKKHIDAKHFVKVYIVNNNGNDITHFGGIIVEQSEKHLLICDLNEFNYDGFVVIRKSDISEIKRTENEKFFDKMIQKEGIKKQLIKKSKDLSLKLDSYSMMFNHIKEKKQPLIIECRYGKKDIFQIGSIVKVDKKKVHINYFNAHGEYDLKPVNSKFKDITLFRIDSPYTNIFHKYAYTIK